MIFFENSNPYPKTKNFFRILNHLVRNLQNIRKISKPRPKTLGVLGVYF